MMASKFLEIRMKKVLSEKDLLQVFGGQLSASFPVEVLKPVLPFPKRLGLDTGVEMPINK